MIDWAGGWVVHTRYANSRTNGKIEITERHCVRTKFHGDRVTTWRSSDSWLWSEYLLALQQLFTYSTLKGERS